jgi:hypothetical protein
MDVQPGEVVVRMVGNTLPMFMTVTKVTEDQVICGDYTFDRETGMEIDEFLEWGPKFGRTGSVIHSEEDLL